jgi:DNA integrity scanning protein DisA with diadenylate cyclase activity
VAEAITACTSATTIVVSQSTGTVSVFNGGQRITEIRWPVTPPHAGA